ncbi:DUF982 domain-containing protein [Rhizobium indicum]|uniref:DUF982 domain-containing protein n=1 Tax=Rhizobium indicum TaxID=2583231 RepID=UPI0026B5062F
MDKVIEADFRIMWKAPVFVRIGTGFRERIEGPDVALHALAHRWPTSDDEVYAEAKMRCIQALVMEAPRWRGAALSTPPSRPASSLEYLRERLRRRPDRPTLSRKIQHVRQQSCRCRQPASGRHGSRFDAGRRSWRTDDVYGRIPEIHRGGEHAAFRFSTARHPWPRRRGSAPASHEGW